MSTSELRLALIATSLIFGLAACGTTPPGEKGLPLARVNGHTIPVHEFERSYVNELLRTGANDTEENRRAHLDRLIDDYLLADEAKKRGLGADSISMARESLSLKAALGGRFYERELLQKLTPVTEPEIRQAYTRYKQPVIARHLYYRSKSEASAAFARLESGGSFLEEARNCFQTTDSLAGYLGEVRYFQVDDAFAEAAFGLSVGSYSAPVRSRQGWHIIRIEDRQYSPILTEADYQARKNGIASLLRIRRRRQSGDDYVRSFMEGLRVEVHSDGVRALEAALDRLERRAGRGAVNIALETEEMPLSLTPETPLATYTQDGDTHVFTASDYVFWLPSLPFAEASQRTAASVGRALRNEVFAHAGEAAGLNNSDEVKADVEGERNAFLAMRMRAQGLDATHTATLREAASVQVDSALFKQIMAL